MVLVPATALQLVVAIMGLLSARTIEARKLKNVGKVLISDSSHN
jgi:hypothetical protein